MDLSNPGHPYQMLADFGLARDDEGHKRYCAAEVALEQGGGRMELGIEQKVLVGLYCPDEAVQTGGRFALSEGPKVVAHAKVLSVLESGHG